MTREVEKDAPILTESVKSIDENSTPKENDERNEMLLATHEDDNSILEIGSEVTSLDRWYGEGIETRKYIETSNLYQHVSFDNPSPHIVDVSNETKDFDQEGLRGAILDALGTRIKEEDLDTGLMAESSDLHSDMHTDPPRNSYISSSNAFPGMYFEPLRNDTNDGLINTCTDTSGVCCGLLENEINAEISSMKRAFETQTKDSETSQVELTFEWWDPGDSEVMDRPTQNPISSVFHQNQVAPTSSRKGKINRMRVDRNPNYCRPNQHMNSRNCGKLSTETHKSSTKAVTGIMVTKKRGRPTKRKMLTTMKPRRSRGKEKIGFGNDTGNYSATRKALGGYRSYLQRKSENKRKLKAQTHQKRFQKLRDKTEACVVRKRGRPRKVVKSSVSEREKSPHHPPGEENQELNSPCPKDLCLSAEGNSVKVNLIKSENTSLQNEKLSSENISSAQLPSDRVEAWREVERKRGRPRKIPSSIEDYRQFPDPPDDETKRNRGHLKKIKSTKAVTDIMVTKKRGRPRKTTILASMKPRRSRCKEKIGFGNDTGNYSGIRKELGGYRSHYQRKSENKRKLKAQTHQKGFRKLRDQTEACVVRKRGRPMKITSSIEDCSPGPPGDEAERKRGRLKKISKEEVHRSPHREENSSELISNISSEPYCIELVDTKLSESVKSKGLQKRNYLLSKGNIPSERGSLGNIHDEVKKKRGRPRKIPSTEDEKRLSNLRVSAEKNDEGQQSLSFQNLYSSASANLIVNIDLKGCNFVKSEHFHLNFKLPSYRVTDEARKKRGRPKKVKALFDRNMRIALSIEYQKRSPDPLRAEYDQERTSMRPQNLYLSAAVNSFELRDLMFSNSVISARVEKINPSLSLENASSEQGPSNRVSREVGWKPRRSWKMRLHAGDKMEFPDPPSEDNHQTNSLCLPNDCLSTALKSLEVDLIKREDSTKSKAVQQKKQLSTPFRQCSSDNITHVMKRSRGRPRKITSSIEDHRHSPDPPNKEIGLNREIGHEPNSLSLRKSSMSATLNAAGLDDPKGDDLIESEGRQQNLVTSSNCKVKRKRGRPSKVNAMSSEGVERPEDLANHFSNVSVEAGFQQLFQTEASNPVHDIAIDSSNLLVSSKPSSEPCSTDSATHIKRKRGRPRKVNAMSSEGVERPEDLANHFSNVSVEAGFQQLFQTEASNPVHDIAIDSSNLLVSSKPSSEPCSTDSATHIKRKRGRPRKRESLMVHSYRSRSNDLSNGHSLPSCRSSKMSPLRYSSHLITKGESSWNLHSPKELITSALSKSTEELEQSEALAIQGLPNVCAAKHFNRDVGKKLEKKNKWTLPLGENERSSQKITVKPHVGEPTPSNEGQERLLCTHCPTEMDSGGTRNSLIKRKIGRPRKRQPLSCSKCTDGNSLGENRTYDHSSKDFISEPHVRIPQIIPHAIEKQGSIIDTQTVTSRLNGMRKKYSRQSCTGQQKFQVEVRKKRGRPRKNSVLSTDGSSQCARGRWGLRKDRGLVVKTKLRRTVRKIYSKKGDVKCSSLSNKKGIKKRRCKASAVTSRNFQAANSSDDKKIPSVPKKRGRPKRVKDDTSRNPSIIKKSKKRGKGRNIDALIYEESPKRNQTRKGPRKPILSIFHSMRTRVAGRPSKDEAVLKRFEKVLENEYQSLITDKNERFVTALLLSRYKPPPIDLRRPQEKWNDIFRYRGRVFRQPVVKCEHLDDSHLSNGSSFKKNEQLRNPRSGLSFSLPLAEEIAGETKGEDTKNPETLKVDGDENNPVIKRRERPRKSPHPKKAEPYIDESNGDVDVVVPVVKRGRGRPPKASYIESPSPYYTILHRSANGDEMPIKRGRGRPPKDPNKPREKKIKRPRGRPRKIRLDEYDTEPKIKRPRGRPRIKPLGENFQPKRSMGSPRGRPRISLLDDAAGNAVEAASTPSTEPARNTLKVALKSVSARLIASPERRPSIEAAQPRKRGRPRKVPLPVYEPVQPEEPSATSETVEAESEPDAKKLKLEEVSEGYEQVGETEEISAGKYSS